MFAISGIYDGTSVVLSGKIPENKKYKVIVTFLEELTEEENDLRNLSEYGQGLEFWEDTAEDLYQDYLIKMARK